MVKIHEKIINAGTFLMVEYPFYGEIFSRMNIYEDDPQFMASVAVNNARLQAKYESEGTPENERGFQVPTMGVNYTTRGANLYYYSKFLDAVNQEYVNTVIIHELLHLVSKHLDRLNGRDPHNANVCQDMVINTSIKETIQNKHLDTNIFQLEIPEEYKGEKAFEELYTWIMQQVKKQQKQNQQGGRSGRSGKGKQQQKVQSGGGQGDKEQQKGKGQSDGQGEGKSDNPYGADKLTDNHLEDEISPELREQMVDDMIEAARARGYITGGMEELLGRLRPKKNNYIKEVLKALSQVLGNVKKRTWSKPNRKGLPLRGFKKYRNIVNIVLDTSGSMHGSFTRVLSYIFRNDIEINLIQIDTEVQSVEKIKSMNQLKKLRIKGLGGTVLNPAIELIAEKYNNYPTVILTDGYTDRLDTYKLKRKPLILSVENECPVNGHARQIVVPQEKNAD